MAWPQLMAQWLVSDRLTEMAQRVAGRSRLAVWQRVVDRLTMLGPTEAKGYIRARAAAIIAAETERLIEQEGARIGRLREQIEAAASQSLIETIVGQMQQRRQPSGHRLAA